MGWVASAWGWISGAATAAAPAAAEGAAVAAPAAGTSGLAVAGNILSIASTGLGIYQAVTADGGSAPKVQNPTVAAMAAERKAAAETKARRKKLAKIGRQSTFKTEESGGLSTKPRTSKKTLLGAGG